MKATRIQVKTNDKICRCLSWGAEVAKGDLGVILMKHIRLQPVAAISVLILGTIGVKDEGISVDASESFTYNAKAALDYTNEAPSHSAGEAASSHSVGEAAPSHSAVEAAPSHSAVMSYEVAPSPYKVTPYGVAAYSSSVPNVSGASLSLPVELDQPPITYSNRASYPVSVEPFFTAGVAIGDVDGDGDSDLLEGNGRPWAQSNYIYFNAENRGLTSRVRLGDIDTTTYITKLADMDNDGDLDAIIAADKYPNSIYLNDGKGNFDQGHEFGTVQSNTRGLTVADINGDGFMDILEISRGSANYIFLNDGKGGLKLATTFGTQKDSTLSVAVADIDRDGKRDLVLANRDGNPNMILRQTSDLVFEEWAEFGSGQDDTRGLVVVDMNGDGALDIVTANIGEANTVLLNQGRGGFLIHQTFDAETSRTYAIEAHDLDGDGDQDIVVANVGDVNKVFLNDGAGTLNQIATFGDKAQSTYALDIGDINGDGRPDIAAGNSGDMTVIYYQRPQ